MSDASENDLGWRGFAFGFAIVLLGIAYIPFGPLAVTAGFCDGWDEARNLENLPIERIWGAWLLFSVFLANGETVLCLLAFGHRQSLVHHRLVKALALAAQLSWFPLGREAYLWYFWVAGSALLYASTPFPDARPGPAWPWPRRKPKESPFPKDDIYPG